ncbi:hypothetical protein DEO72_LG5g844 [Vigna unguiculata]|uniref:Uncharacterized protein n=1 Tax=Vigna unguiculata TaxID=3917 RepID=A0A4D6LVU0_VIGUN|nr:hypothetical protein DEO72_LG5g844 [Vigna unguiculata]
MNENSGRDHSHRSSAHPNPRLGFCLLGFTKPNTDWERFPATTATEEPHQVVFKATQFSVVFEAKYSSTLSTVFFSFNV